jgi:hypothetical protein
MRTYLSGRISGVEGYNRELFHRVATEIRNAGDVCFNPLEADEQYGISTADAVFNGPNPGARREALKRDYIWLCEQAERIVMLPGWAKSFGAKSELAVARAIGLDVKFYRPKKKKTSNKLQHQPVHAA